MVSLNKIILLAFMILPLFTGSMSVGGLQKAYAGEDCFDADDGTPCGPGNACNAEVCQAGQCVLEPAFDGDQCGDGDSCFEEICFAGECLEFSESFDGLRCEDSDTCFFNICNSGQCELVTDPFDGDQCGEGDVCNVEVCDLGQCVLEPAFDGDQCGDGDSCFEEICFAGECLEFSESFDGLRCEDSDTCFFNICNSGQCELVTDPFDGDQCGEGDVCNVEVCDLGQCVLEPAFDGQQCGPGDVCILDVCEAGQCVQDTAPEGAVCSCSAGSGGCDGAGVCIGFVLIDVKPGSDPSCFNSNGKGAIPVAILGTDSLDVTLIDPSTLKLDNQPVKTNKRGTPLVDITDINNDGIDDMVIKFKDNGVYLMSDTVAKLTGQLFDGQPIEGTDSICITR